MLFVFSKFLQLDTAHSKNNLTADMFYHEIKSKHSFMKELARQKTKINNAFKTRPNGNQNEKWTFKVTHSIIQLLKG